ncbi:ABC transporter ATP-binding protein [Methylobacterium mesophilicum SR1.6/6]|uniref:ABC transporter ATP-binding protein n=1 Tax=Methylobacterium mesophilicum SR1.6/6 TaxID=908290 RepID=A0A6B9FGR4_9HYPH|nr:ABC transporter ATP-binding protein [Methylobacterium mesophilicum]QGY01911.1 ABC transporter ATP-binding protein [Methylobacterium mesophilicum SR1.6/6]
MVAAAIREHAAQAAGSRLTVDAVSHAFAIRGAPLPVLDRVSLTVEPGGFVALLGPSGCGKSTLLRLVAGLEPPDAGTIAIDGDPVEDPDPSRLLVFQDPTLYPWRTVRANVALGLEARGVGRERATLADAALHLVGLDGFAEVYPHQLSGGMAQRVALARALVNEPRLLLLDEPLGKLDALTRLAMQAELLRLWQEKRFTALLVTHDVEEALVLAERVIVLSDRPAAIRAELPVPVAYPRHRDDPEIVRLRREILGILGHPT